jgi:Right handed beta helix region
MKLRTSLVALAALVLVAVAPEANGGGGTPITTCGQTVTTSAVLTQDLVCTGDGVILGASGITIDLKGFTIRGDRGTGDNGIEDTGGFDNITIKNGVVRNFEYGVWAEPFADAFIVQNLLASGHVQDGIHIHGNSASVKSSTSSANSYGVSVIGSKATIKSTSASGNRFGGISANGNFALIQSSSASGNGYVGIAVQGDGAVLKGNRAEANGFFGQDSDLFLWGINVVSFTTPPVGKNIARGNDDPAECNPAYLC